MLHGRVIQVSNLKKYIGLLKSKIIYDFKPFNQRKLNRFYAEFISENHLCFDVGAHTGNRTNTWLKLGAKVISIEPSPFLSKHLKGRFEKNKGFQLVEKAIGFEEGKGTFSLSSLYPTVSTFSKAWAKTVETELKTNVYDKTIEVEIITLDSLIHEFGMPQFCKIDIEGFEAEALKGLSSPIPSLSFEFYSGHKKTCFDCLELINALGSYEFNWAIGETLNLIEPEWLDAASIQNRIESISQKGSGDVYARLTK